MTTTNPIEPGSAVRWRTTRTAGIGQYLRTDPDGTAIVRPFLPTLSKEIRTPTAMLTALPELTEHIRQAATVAAHIAAGLR